MAVPTTRRFRSILAAVWGMVLVAGAAGAATAPPVAPRLVPSFAPGHPNPGLEYFRLPAGRAESTYRLLVVPVRFPQDSSLGGGDLEAELNGSSESLRSFYLETTGGRLRVESTLAPVITADHPRAHYTVTEDGRRHFGLDPAAYPRNTQGLVEKITAKIVDAVDFKYYDNTGDGLIDGLLLLHSGPRSAEASDEEIPLDALFAHSFTLPAPVWRGSAFAFPYAVAATRDGLGAWAHELGHLLGLPDLYVDNPFPFCPREGLGEWSLMATGANRLQGAAPSGLDPFSRGLLGIPPVPAAAGTTVRLEDHDYVRTYRPGQAGGSRYFLVERRVGQDGPQTPATVVYYVDEDAVDNRDCNRPLVSVRAVITSASASLDDFTDPSLHDGEDNPTGLALDFQDDTVRIRFPGEPPLRVERLEILQPFTPPGLSQRQPVAITIRNLDPDNAVQALLTVTPLDPGTNLCAVLEGAAWPRTVPPGGSVTDTSWSLIRCSQDGNVPFTSGEFDFELTKDAGAVQFARRDTLALVGRITGLGAPGLLQFQPLNMNPGVALPWQFDIGDTSWTAETLDALADAYLLSPWFIVPENARLRLDHLWELDALSLDLAADAGQVCLMLQEENTVALSPPLGWGQTAERGTGNALGGQEVLSESGERIHVLDLSAFPRRVARIGLRVAGDVVGGSGLWKVRDLSVLPAPDARFSLAEDGPRRLQIGAVAETPFVPGVTLSLFRGPVPASPTSSVSRTAWDGSAFTLLGTNPETARFELVWETSDGRADAVAAVFTSDGAERNRFLAEPTPNPLPMGTNQIWRILHTPEDPAGRYHFDVFTVAGRRLVSRLVRVDTPGTREVVWNGLDFAGRAMPGGVYLLRVRQPGGAEEIKKLVVIP